MRKNRINYVIPIYCTTLYWNGWRGLLDFSNYSEEELYDFIESENHSRIIVVAPQQGIFRDKFIAPILDKDGFISRSGIFRTTLCGESIRYKIMIDPNLLKDKETPFVGCSTDWERNTRRNTEPFNVKGLWNNK